MHNWLLDIDGLDTEWGNGVSASTYEGALGNFEEDDLPEPLRHLHNPEASRSYDISQLGRGNDSSEGMEDDTNEHHGITNPEVAPGQAIPVRILDMNYFRNKLIKHFDIAFQ